MNISMKKLLYNKDNNRKQQSGKDQLRLRSTDLTLLFFYVGVRQGMDQSSLTARLSGIGL